MATARQLVAESLGRAAAVFPNLAPSIFGISEDACLDPRDARLAIAIHRNALQRWITLEYLLNQHLNQPTHQLEPAMRGVLLSAAAQMVCLERVPAHAVINESVELARQLVRPGAAGMVNAVLRKLNDDVGAFVQTEAPLNTDRVPLPAGHKPLAASHLPDPQTEFAEHLCVATSHRIDLVRHWIATFGKRVATQLCLHGIINPPMIVAVDESLTPAKRTTPHEQGGFVCWTGTRDQLGKFLAAHGSRRVQDPTAASPVAATHALKPQRVLDYCAGLGTKTRQLAALHSTAMIVATDTDDARRRMLSDHTANLPNVQVIEPDASPRAEPDLLVLDVPCSNTGVLARRPEARYRFSTRSVRRLVGLQRDIIKATLSNVVAPGGHVLYCTCSLDPRENEQQAQWLATQFNVEFIDQRLTLPAGRDATYHDGGFYALFRTR